ncbi:expressed unknown protein [Seminavis robusta]|uniref:ZZ-type domain-containing protein n=1 Tax=Seminavis robusta TaxID=568900 RepID=A0A9N8DLX8_9STRA|nr:expressed unknown protein [Seminavis robusta]|eukprot:Sro157_g071120.1 n/a (177) ;mRNA; f:32103-32633
MESVGSSLSKEPGDHLKDTVVSSLPTKKRQRRVCVLFVPSLVDQTAEAPEYDRTAEPTDIFDCDGCGIRIPSGIKGYEPYATCTTCEDGFDLCGSCCGTDRIMKICAQTEYLPDNKPKTISVDSHKHMLQVVDRGAEIAWANEGSVRNLTKELKPSRSPRKTPKSKGQGSGKRAEK